MTSQRKFAEADDATEACGDPEVRSHQYQNEDSTVIDEETHT